MKINEAVKKELAEILEAEGTLTPQNVREVALKRDTALHQYFEVQGAFDESKALEQYQLLVAQRLIIQVKVTLLNSKNEPVRIRAYTSLKADRASGNGYRATVTVLENKELRAQMLETAYMELSAFQRKYQTLNELKPVMKAIEKLLPNKSKRQEARHASQA